MLSAKPWKPEAVLRLMVAVFVCMSLVSLVTAALLPAAERETAAGRFLVLLSGTVGFHWSTLLLIAIFLRAHETGWRTGFGLDSGNAMRSLALGIGAGVAMLPVCWGLGQASAWVMVLLQQQPEVQFTVQTLQVAVASDQRVYAAFAAVLLAPIVEELLFRGVLYPAVKQLGHPRLALWGTSAFFAVIHVNAMTLVPLFVLSLVLTWLYERTGNLLAPVATHLLFNLANFLMLTFQPELQHWLHSLK